MAERAFYPIFLDLTGRAVVLVGAGTVGLRKARGLQEAGARLTVISPAFDPGFDSLAIRRVERAYSHGDLTGATLVFAATNSREVNRQVGLDAEALGIPAN